MKKIHLVALFCFALLSTTTQAYSPPDNPNPQNNSFSINANHGQVNSFQITSVDVYDFEVNVSDQAANEIGFALTSAKAVVNSETIFCAEDLKNIYCYVLKPPLKYVSKYTYYSYAPIFKTPYSIRLPLHQKKC
jgi:hypothetical protein